MNKKRSQAGQAMMEYIVLIPPLLLISTSITALVPNTGQGAICDLDSAFNSDICSDVAEATQPPAPEPPPPGTDPTKAPTPTETPTPTLTPTPTPVPTDDCVVWSPETGSALCDKTEGCDILKGTNSGYYLAPDDIDSFVIKAGRDYMVYESGRTRDGCYNVQIAHGSVSWVKVGSGKYCKDVSHLQVWQVPWCE